MGFIFAPERKREAQERMQQIMSQTRRELHAEIRQMKCDGYTVLFTTHYLDEAEELDEGNPNELGLQYRGLRDALPAVSVLGGCCGTDHRHVAEICSAWLAPATGG